ncbi:MAG: hypothetical protein ABJ013_09430 [Halioglobus sp.]
MKINKAMFTRAMGAALVASAISVSPAIQASETGAFVGGILAGKVVHNMRQRTEAEQQQAYYAQQQAQQPVQQAAPAASGQSTEQKLAELDKLAAGGYITPAEYKAKRQAVIDSM